MGKEIFNYLYVGIKYKWVMCLTFNGLLRNLFSGSWVRELFRNVIINFIITYLSGFIDLNEFKKKLLVELTKKRLGRWVCWCNLTANNNETKRKNPGAVNSPWSPKYRILHLGDSWRECARIVCPPWGDRRHPVIHRLIDWLTLGCNFCIL